MFPLSRFFAILILLLFLLDVSPLWAESSQPDTVKYKPLWEVGVSGNAASIPLYRGSDHDKLYALPLPYFIYRGRFFQSDRDGVRGIFYSSDHFETTLSGWGNPPVDDDGTAREGMGDLDALLELGPALKWHPFKRQPDQHLYLQTAVRTIISIGLPDDFRTHHRGYRWVTGLYYANESHWDDSGWAWGSKLEIDFTDNQYNDYIYGVSDVYANDLRPAYDTNGGYAGAMGALYLSRRLTDTISFAVYTQLDSISGAVYESSPLVETSTNFTIAASLVWKLRDSLEQVPFIQ